MPSLNKVFLIGNLTRDPEVKFLPSGNAVTELRLAVNRSYRTKDGQEREEVLFVSASVFGRTAENCGKYLHKGSPVHVEGRLKMDEWERDGKKNSRLTVVAENVQFLSSRGGEGGGSRGTRGDSAGAYPRTESSEPSADEPSMAEPGPGMGAGDDEDALPF
ncbi:MAG: single-stranded DNA-binding protein [Kiritimatiellae bacterium]|nr:single-stranded DNA-binding protein [Kiritimatiellia bacterium]